MITIDRFDGVVIDDLLEVKTFPTCNACGSSAYIIQLVDKYNKRSSNVFRCRFCNFDFEIRSSDIPSFQ